MEWQLQMEEQLSNEEVHIHTKVQVSVHPPFPNNLPTLTRDMRVAAHRKRSLLKSWTVRVLFLDRISFVVRAIFVFSACISAEGADCGGNFSSLSGPPADLSIYRVLLAKILRFHLHGSLTERQRLRRKNKT